MKQVRLLGLLSFVIMSFVMSSCVGEKDYYEGPNEESSVRPADEYFDFSTYRRVKLDIDYGTWGSNTLLGIFTEQPVVPAEDSDKPLVRTDISAVASLFTDKQGRYSGEIEVSADVDRLYVATLSPWLPDVVEAEITDGKAVVRSGNYEWTAASSRKATRAAEQLTVVPITTGGYKNLYSIVGDKWNEWGKAGDPNGITDEGTIVADNLKQIYRTLMHKPATYEVTDFAAEMYRLGNGINNSNLVVSTEHVNCTIAESYLEDGEVKSVDKAQVSLTFINETGSYMSTLGYYYYKTGECPAKPANLKKYMVFPNASVGNGSPFSIGNHRYGNRPLGAGNAPLQPNVRVQLLYEDEQGNVSDHFPPGYTIGFFIIANADGSNSNGDKRPGANELKGGRSFVYSNAEWNAPDSKGVKAKYIALTDSDGRIVYGMEDGVDGNHCDILFSVEADPAGAIQDPERPVIDPEIPVVYSTTTTTCSYAFEDQWPMGGDYDLNDVIIRHERAVTITQDNLIMKIADEFTPVNPEGAATFRNGFAVTGSAEAFAAVTEVSSGVTAERETCSYIVTTNTNADRGRMFSVVRKFATPVKAGAATEEWNPYIISQYEPDAEKRTEIHLPKHAATSKHHSELTGQGDDAYFIDKSNMFPFAIKIPEDFQPAPERMRIDNAYSRYPEWVKSCGEEHPDWYKYPSF